MFFGFIYKVDLQKIFGKVLFHLDVECHLYFSANHNQEKMTSTEEKNQIFPHFFELA